MHSYVHRYYMYQEFIIRNTAICFKHTALNNELTSPDIYQLCRYVNAPIHKYVNAT